jgi:excinuclease ABC subunit A
MLHNGEWIRVRGAREHNLQNVDVDLPRGALTVLTGPSGSGKSTLAFDTLFAEGQRRYLETLRADSRALFDQLQRPDVDLVDGLPPTLCVAQQMGPPQPRSTLATLTEIHDHLRLLWARLGTPHCYQCGTPIRRQGLPEIIRRTLARPVGQKVMILAPVVRGQKGEHKEVFQELRRAGFLRARVNGALIEIRDIPKLNPRQEHTVELVVDRLVIREGIEDRLTESLQTAVKHSGGPVIVSEAEDGDWHDEAFSTRYACPKCDISYPELEPRALSFNSPHGACPRCGGLGQVIEFAPALLMPDPAAPLSNVADHLADLRGLTPKQRKQEKEQLRLLLAHYPAGEEVLPFLHGSDRTDPPWPGVVPLLHQLTVELADKTDEESEERREQLQAYTGLLPCPECGGARLNREARSVLFAGKGLHEVTALTVENAAAWFTALPAAKPVDKVRELLVREIGQRLEFLQQVGVGYLTLDRPVPTLSGGESQRARLASHLGAGLLGVCYILDEPTVGLHPRDTGRLIGALRGLQERGNTVIVVEHDEAVMREADYLVDMGPGAGKQGGRVLAAGTVAEVSANPASVTGPWLARRESVAADVVPTPHPGPPPQGGREENRAPRHAQYPTCGLRSPSPLAGEGRGGGSAQNSNKVTPPAIVIHGARHHNLKNLTATFPLGRLVCVTGVSGSGKSSLVRDTLANAVRRHLGLTSPAPGAHDRITGLDQIDKLIEVDQSPLGRSPRSGPATYTGIFDEIRRVFTKTKEAKVRGYTAGRFSFNVKGGRCDVCEGRGARRIALHLLPDLTLPCTACRGKRFNAATLAIRYKGKSIADVLELSAADALVFFANVPALVRPLEALVDVGLGYLTLGQPSSTLSGGEAQRVKLAAALARPATGRTLVLLDEPTTGLHFADVAHLLGVLRRLVDRGNTLVVIEHHLDMIAAADWVLDLGPDGGAAGGYLLAAGPPVVLAAIPASVTGRFLAAVGLEP